MSPVRFRKELMRDQGLILGRYDARFEGTDIDAAGENPGYDPSSTGITGAFVSAFHDYLDRELKYTSARRLTFRAAPTSIRTGITATGRPTAGGGGLGQQPQPLRKPTWPATWPMRCARIRA